MIQTNLDNDTPEDFEHRVNAAVTQVQAHMIDSMIARIKDLVWWGDFTEADKCLLEDAGTALQKVSKNLQQEATEAKDITP